MKAFKDRFEMALQSWSLGHYPDHDYILQACRELDIRLLDLGNCHFEFVSASKPLSTRIVNWVKWLNAQTADGLSLRYEGEMDFPAGSFLVPFIRDMSFDEHGDEGEIVFGFRKSDYATLAAKYAASSVTVDTFGPLSFPVGTGDHADDIRQVFDLAKAFGVQYFEVHRLYDHEIPILEALQDEYQIRVAVHNHGRDHAYGRIAQLKELFDRTSLAFSLDTAWAVDAGEDPLEMARAFHDRLISVHCKEFEYTDDGRHYGVVSGSGTFDLPGLVKLLSEFDYQGLFALEYEGFERDSITPLRQSKLVVEELVARL